MSLGVLTLILVAFGGLSLFLQARSGKSLERFRSTSPSRSELMDVKVVHIVDGDTVYVWGRGKEIKVRLAAIDCPEGDQPWGQNATRGLIKLIGARSKRLCMETHGEDSYGRTIATVFVKDGSRLINVNEKMVARGHAWVSRVHMEPLPEPRRFRLTKIERWARSNGVGLWRTENPIPPWKWRKGAEDANPRLELVKEESPEVGESSNMDGLPEEEDSTISDK